MSFYCIKQVTYVTVFLSKESSSQQSQRDDHSAKQTWKQYIKLYINMKIARNNEQQNNTKINNIKITASEQSVAKTTVGFKCISHLEILHHGTSLIKVWPNHLDGGV